MGRPRQCEICKEAQSKYKCPSCLLPYCSVTCFKKHKEIPCKTLLPPAEKTAPVAFPERSYRVDKQSSILQKKQLQSLVDSHEILDALKDEELQNLIRKIDCSKDPEDELDKAMEGEFFCKFTDKLGKFGLWKAVTHIIRGS